MKQSAVSVGFPSAWHASAWVSSACRGNLHVLQWRCGICKQRRAEICSFSEALRSTSDGGRGSTKSAIWLLQELQSAAEAFKRQISASAKSQRGRVFVAEEKKSEMWWRSGHLYGQTPPPIWRAMEGCIAIGLRAAAEPLVCVLVLHEPMDVQLHCVIKKGFHWRGKNSFSPYKRLRHSTSEY